MEGEGEEEEEEGDEDEEKVDLKVERRHQGRARRLGNRQDAWKKHVCGTSNE